mmetsp:Transcript_64078/g.107104  ORF Transcript_64078/g.107104 Transcript_64078/m.107104 type:complete len:208 (-) Transcript_64078:2143-2766(-)
MDRPVVHIADHVAAHGADSADRRAARTSRRTAVCMAVRTVAARTAHVAARTAHTARTARTARSARTAARTVHIAAQSRTAAHNRTAVHTVHTAVRIAANTADCKTRTPAFRTHPTASSTAATAAPSPSSPSAAAAVAMSDTAMLCGPASPPATEGSLERGLQSCAAKSSEPQAPAQTCGTFLAVSETCPSAHHPAVWFSPLSAPQIL